MENKQVYQFRGLNLRGSPINKDGSYAEDCDNVLLNSRRELIKRFGYDESIVSSGIIDVIEYVYGNKLLFIKSDGIYEESGGALVQIGYFGEAITYSTIVDSAEADGSIYITDTSGGNYLFKYDGAAFYRAGLPAPDITSVSMNAGSNSYYIRAWYGYLDNQGGLIFGDYYQSGEITSSDDTNVSVTLNTLYETEFPYNASGTNINGHDMIAPFLYVAVSENETYGYTIRETSGITKYGPSIYPLMYVDHSSATYSDSESISSSELFMEDYYDSSVVKGLPPRCKYVEMYGETLVLGGRVDDGTSQSKTANYRQSVYWSDTGLGSTVETFPPFSYQQVGKTDEGEIKGLFANENELTIMKDFQVYYLNGILIGRAFRLTNSLSGGIGCVSHKSIVEIQGGCLFQSDRGIYFAGGGSSPQEASDIIEPLFTEDTTELDFSRCRAIRDTKNEKVYFFIPASDSANNLVLVYDYYYKEWFKFSNYDASNGLAIVDNQIYHSDGESLFSWSQSYNDDGVAINGYYQSVFHHFGVPSLLKKFVRAVLLSIGSESFACYLKTRKNWKSTDDTNLSMDFTSDLDLEDKPINLSNARSLSLIFGNNTLDEGMLISGYEIEWMPNQRNVKGDT